MSEATQWTPESGHPPIGTLIDGNTLELVEILGTGGYGVVYRAVEVRSSNPRSYAVKCLPGDHDPTSPRRHLHMREIGLHQLASAHPSVITLYRIVRQRNFTFLIMDYAPDGDMFGQILQECSYLGRDALIKHVFLQILDAVQHCHLLGIYHRDLKPENVLCFDQGLRVAITDFGLATTDKKSKEFKTGSVYHMSPECQAGDGAYSPMHNDIWSLGIMLLNLVTGRNPWTSATLDDPTFWDYRRGPRHFLTTVLPISEELNDVLVKALAIDWRKRISLSDFRAAITSIRTFYSDQVVFEGSLATTLLESELYFRDTRDQKPLPEVSRKVDRRRIVSPYHTSSQITTLDGLVEEEAIQHAGYDNYREVVPFHSPVYSTYEYSDGTSSSDSASPITPVSDYGDGGQACSFMDWDRYTPGGVEDVNQRYEEYEPSGVFLGSVFEDDDSIVSSAFHATNADNFKTTKRYSSPNTSIYSVSEDFDFFGDVGLDSIAEVEERCEEKKGTTIGTQAGGGSQPIKIPRIKSRSPVFNPMRFFPRSSGKSWLNRKIRLPL